MKHPITSATELTDLILKTVSSLIEHNPKLLEEVVSKTVLIQKDLIAWIRANNGAF